MPTTSLLFIDIILDPTLNPALAAGDPGSTFDATSIFYSVWVSYQVFDKGMLSYIVNSHAAYCIRNDMYQGQFQVFLQRLCGSQFLETFLTF